MVDGGDRVVVYTGDDENGDYLYKFIGQGSWARHRQARPQPARSRHPPRGGVRRQRRRHLGTRQAADAVGAVWPYGGRPRPATVVITRADGGRIGS